MILNSKQSVGIIGGEGKTGGQFADLFRKAGFSVKVTGSDNANLNRTLIDTCDILIFAVPLRHTEAIIKKELAAAHRTDQLVMDLSSLKEGPISHLLSAPGEIMGLHPLFAPSTEPKGQTIVLCPARCSAETTQSLQSIFESLGLRVRIMSAAQHDKLMAVLQVLPHIKSLLVADVLQEVGADLDEIMENCTPAYSIELDLVGRFLDDSPELYGPIMFANPHTADVLSALKKAIDRCQNFASSSDDAFAQHYRSLQDFFGPHAKEGREHSEECIRTLTSLS